MQNKKRNSRKQKQPPTIRRANKLKPFRAKDGALIYELLRPQNSPIKNMGLAIGSLGKRKKAIPHYHKISEEVYFILSGKGAITIDGKTRKIKAGNAIYIPVHSIHALVNSSNKNLEVLCISSPPYADKDFYFSN